MAVQVVPVGRNVRDDVFLFADTDADNNFECLLCLYREYLFFLPNKFCNFEM